MDGVGGAARSGSHFGLGLVFGFRLSISMRVAQISCGRGHCREGLGSEASWLWGILIDIV